MLMECLTNRWRDHVGPGEDRHMNFRSDEELNSSIRDDDLIKLEKLLSKNEVNEIQEEVQIKLKNAINYSEESSFPEISETTDEVYG